MLRTRSSNHSPSQHLEKSLNTEDTLLIAGRRQVVGEMGTRFPSLPFPPCVPRPIEILEIENLYTNTSFMYRVGHEDPLSVYQSIRWLNLPKMFSKYIFAARFEHIYFCGLCETLPYWEEYPRVIFSTFFCSYWTTAAVNLLHLIHFRHR